MGMKIYNHSWHYNQTTGNTKYHNLSPFQRMTRILAHILSEKVFESVGGDIIRTNIF